PLIAEQVGNLLGLATGFHERDEGSRHRGQMARPVLRRIESDYAEPDLSPERVAGDCGISKRYLQTLLAGSGTSFVQELNATRLDRASDMLSDPRAAGLSVAEIAFRNGFLDAGYFTRLFRKRFGITPREWRAGHAPQSYRSTRTAVPAMAVTISMTNPRTHASPIPHRRPDRGRHDHCPVSRGHAAQILV